MHWKVKHEAIKAIKSFVLIYHLFSKFTTNSISKFNNCKYHNVTSDHHIFS